MDKLDAAAETITLGNAKVHHLVDWHKMSHPERLKVLRSIVLARGRDPRIAKKAVEIFREKGVKPRDYAGQAAALLAWVQDPKHVYYVNEPGERLQDPIHTIEIGHGDCDDQSLLLTCFFESVGLPWKFVLSGIDTKTGEKIRYIEGTEVPPNVRWTHIYCMVGTPPFKPKKWFFCETTVIGVPLGWDVISGDRRYIPEMDTGDKNKPPMVYFAGPPKPNFRPAPLPPPAQRSPAYKFLYGNPLGSFVPSGTGLGTAPLSYSTGEARGSYIPSAASYGTAAGSMFGIAAGAALAADMAEGQPRPVTSSGSSSSTPTAAEVAAAKRAKRDDIIRGVVVGTSVSLATSLVQPIIAPIVEAAWATLVNGVMGQDYWQRLKQRNRSE